jgi:hypothetical protein
MAQNGMKPLSATTNHAEVSVLLLLDFAQDHFVGVYPSHNPLSFPVFSTAPVKGAVKSRLTDLALRRNKKTTLILPLFPLAGNRPPWSL